MADAIHRYEVPVDDRWHPLHLSGDILHVNCRNPRAVEVWAMHTDGPKATRSFRVYGTGHPIPPDLQYVGTAIAPGGGTPIAGDAMRRAVTVGLFVLAWTIGPVAYVHDGSVPPPAPEPSVTVSR